jgi:hypothetical protein
MLKTRSQTGKILISVVIVALIVCAVAVAIYYGSPLLGGQHTSTFSSSSSSHTVGSTDTNAVIIIASLQRSISSLQSQLSALNRP